MATVGKRGSDVGTLYRGRTGQWAWVFHRFTGVAIILFLFAHVADTALVGWGPEAYDRVISAYENPIVRMLELGLVLAVLYHSINGVRVLLIDFWPRAARHQSPLFYATMATFFAAAIPISVIMIRGTFQLLEG